jgi:hypothetical protein
MKLFMMLLKKEFGFIFKLDYEKAYDRVDREFIITMVMNSREHILSIVFHLFSPFSVHCVHKLLCTGASCKFSSAIKSKNRCLPDLSKKKKNSQVRRQSHT